MFSRSSTPGQGPQTTVQGPKSKVSKIREGVRPGVTATVLAVCLIVPGIFAVVNGRRSAQPEDNADPSETSAVIRLSQPPLLGADDGRRVTGGTSGNRDRIE